MLCPGPYIRVGYDDIFPDRPNFCTFIRRVQAFHAYDQLILAERVVNNIIQEVNKARYFSISVDSIADVLHIDTTCVADKSFALIVVSSLHYLYTILRVYYLSAVFKTRKNNGTHSVLFYPYDK